MFNADCHVGVVYLIMCKTTTLLHAALIVRSVFFVCTQTILNDRFYGASACVCALATAVQLKWSCKYKSQLQTAQRLMFLLNSE